MNARRSAVAALVVVAATVIAVVLASGREAPYTVRVQLDNASGLRSGRAVKVAGAKVGKVGRIHLGRGDVVTAELEIERTHAPLGRGASVSIESTNLLGEKFVSVDPGDRDHPEPAGFVVPPARVRTPVDLDQVLDVLDAPTRVRLGILINEAGLALTGRHADFSAVLAELPPSLTAATTLLDEVVADRRTVASLVEHSDRFLRRFAGERRQLGRVVDYAGQTMTALAARRASLERALARAPGMLRTLRAFVGRLQRTARDLRPASRAISASASPLRGTLGALAPFQREAKPALAQATKAAPALTRLATGATPVVRRANPALTQLAEMSRRLAPVTRTLDRSVADLYGLVEGWARATQTRDGLGHVFRGQVLYSLDTVRSALARLAPPRKTRRRGGKKAPDRAAAPEDSRPQGAATPPAPRPGLLPKVVDPILKVLKPPKGASAPSEGSGNAVTSLLDFLLKP